MNNNGDQLNNNQPTIGTPNQPKNHWKVLAIILGALLVLTLVAIAAIFIFTEPRTKKDDNTTESTTSKTTELSPKDVINKITSELAKDYTLVDDFAPDTAGIPNGQFVIEHRDYAPDYRVDGYEYFSNYDGSGAEQVVFYGNGAVGLSDDELQNKIAKIYKDFDLEKATVNINSDNDTYEFYKGRGVVCAYDSKVMAMCGQTSVYEAVAKETKPFTEAYVRYITEAKTTDEDPNASLKYQSFSRPTIEDSQVSGYQTAYLSIASAGRGYGGIGKFWRQSSGEWNLHTINQELLRCSEYNTTDLRNAYKGYECFIGDTNDVGKVQ
jgi:hypothetical protein